MKKYIRNLYKTIYYFFYRLFNRKKLIRIIFTGNNHFRIDEHITTHNNVDLKSVGNDYFIIIRK